MRRVAISGYYGFHNAGDEVMLASIIAELREQLTDVGITVFSNDPKATAATYGVDACGRLDIRRMIRVLQRSDLFISGGGSLLQNVTSCRNLPYQLWLLLLARRFCPRVMIYGQGIGPVRSKIGLMIMKRVLNRLDAITVRDADSYDMLTGMGVDTRIGLASDPAFLHPHVPDASAGSEVLVERGVDVSRGCIGVFPRVVRQTGVVQCLADTINEVRAKIDVSFVLVPMQQRNDVEICEEIRDRVSGECMIVKPDSAQQLIDVISALDVCVGIRLHSLVLAVKAGVMPVAIAYDPKVASFMTEARLRPALSADDVDSEQLVSAVIDAWNDRDVLSSVVCKQRSRLIERAQLSSDWAVELIGGQTQ